jgi:hypothetical protein
MLTDPDIFIDKYMDNHLLKLAQNIPGIDKN